MSEVPSSLTTTPPSLLSSPQASNSSTNYEKNSTSSMQSMQNTTSLSNANINNNLSSCFPPFSSTYSVPVSSPMLLYNPCSSTFATIHTQASIKPYMQIHKTAETIKNEFANIFPTQSIHHIIPVTNFKTFQCAVYSDIGGRKCQEDRFVICPELIKNRNDSALFGVFDGTVGDFASDTVKSLVVPHLIASPSWQEIIEKVKTAKEEDFYKPDFEEEIKNLMAQSMDYMYKNADSELLLLCRNRQLHYSSSTSVVAIFLHHFLAVGHLGDSRIAVGRVDELTHRIISADFVTSDHKPDQDVERFRIESSGGSVEYLHNHNDKPFIRGGDFTARKQKGEQPMQLQYSRAFGGKDLKVYGLSNQADIKVITMDSSMKCMILASDGLWDVQPAYNAIDMALKFKNLNENPAEGLVRMTLDEQLSRNQSADNITAITVFF